MKIVTVSPRGQISLGKLADWTHYAATVDEYGIITLTPVVIQPITKEDPNGTR